ncbi:MAG: DNA-processing protein DprA [Armatimonadota bacterium]
MNERAAWVALSAVSGLGPSRFRKLIEVYGSPTSALKAGPEALAEVLALPSSACAEIGRAAERLEEIERELASLDEEGVQALTWQDEAYPARLLATASPPPVLWWKSARCSTQPEAAAAIVGSREVSEQALAEAYRIGQMLAEAGVSVVSGMAAGVDAAAHEGALATRGPTVGVCGCGIVTALTRGREGLAGRMAERGAVCSELAPTAPLSPKMLFARNRIIAGLADAVVVVEARAEGGAVHTANCAREEGRPVLVVDWPGPDAAGGNRSLVRGGAIPVEPGADPVAAFAEAIEG